jgi:hypothetical protein
MFSPWASRLAGRATTCAKRLDFINFGDKLQDRVREMTNEDRAKAARMLSKGLETARTIFSDAEEIRSGFGPISIANLKGWTKNTGCPVRLHISGDDGNFYIGADENHGMRIELPPMFWRRFGDLPNIVTLTNWDE